MVKTNFTDLRAYRLAEEVADHVWDVVAKWDGFAKRTVGAQIVRAADSIGANIAEGVGRGSFKDNRRFVKIARASLCEVKHWLRRAYARNLLADAQVAELKRLADELAPKLNAYLKSIGNVSGREHNGPQTTDN